MTREEELKQLATECVVLLKRQIEILEEMGVQTPAKSAKITGITFKAKLEEPNTLKHLMNKMGAK